MNTIITWFRIKLITNFKILTAQEVSNIFIFKKQQNLSIRKSMVLSQTRHVNKIKSEMLYIYLYLWLLS